jgi:hypothetical protein
MASLHNEYLLYHEHSAPLYRDIDFDVLHFGHRDPEADGSYSFDGFVEEYIDRGDEFPPDFQGHYDDVAHTIVFHNTGFEGAELRVEHLVFTGRTINSPDDTVVDAMTGVFHRFANILLETGAEGDPSAGPSTTSDTYLGVWAAAYSSQADAAARRMIEAAEAEEHQQEIRRLRAIFVPRGTALPWLPPDGK